MIYFEIFASLECIIQENASKNNLIYYLLHFFICFKNASEYDLLHCLPYSWNILKLAFRLSSENTNENEIIILLPYILQLTNCSWIIIFWLISCWCCYRCHSYNNTFHIWVKNVITRLLSMFNQKINHPRKVYLRIT